MDETKTAWFEWIARNALYVFWIVWGAAIGAFGAVFFHAVPMGDDALKAYLAVITVMAGGALGLITSRAMDHRADRRKVRRKIFSMLVHVEALRDELLKLNNQLAAVIRPMPADGATLTDEQ